MRLGGRAQDVCPANRTRHVLELFSPMIRVADPSWQQWEPRRVSIYHPEARPAAAIKRAFVESATTIEKVLTALAVLAANVRNQEQAALDMLRIELARGILAVSQTGL